MPEESFGVIGGDDYRQEGGHPLCATGLATDQFLIRRTSLRFSARLMMSVRFGVQDRHGHNATSDELTEAPVLKFIKSPQGRYFSYEARSLLEHERW